MPNPFLVLILSRILCSCNFSRLSCPNMLSRYQAILSRLSRPVYPVRDALSMLHFPGCPVQSIPSWISCPLSSLSCLGYPVQVVYTVLSISCPGGPVHCLVSSSSISCLQAILSRLSCPVYLCSISCPGYRVKTIWSSLSVQYSKSCPL